jgi:hypothetical protein
MAEVFISYGRKDADLVAPIKARLDELGVDTWIDRDIPTGERYRQVIRSKLKDAKAVIVCWSPEAVESNWVDFEAQVALEVGTYVPVFLVQCFGAGFQNQSNGRFIKMGWSTKRSGLARSHGSDRHADRSRRRRCSRARDCVGR